MALVPFRVSGPAADPRVAERLLQFPGGITLRLTQHPGQSGAVAPTAPVAAAAAGLPSADAAAAPTGTQPTATGPPLSSLANVGLVVWQAGFLLADYLLRMSPLVGREPGAWRSLTAVDLGTGSGVVGIALALAGARVFLTDLPHVLPLAASNVAANCDPCRHRTVVCPYTWGEDPDAVAIAEAGAGGSSGAAAAATVSPLAGLQPDLITAADVLYHPDLLPPLMRAVQLLSAPHTVTYVSYRVRQGGEVAAFLALAEAAGFAVTEVPDGELHEEYRAAAAVDVGCGGEPGDLLSSRCAGGGQSGGGFGGDDDGAGGGSEGATTADWLGVERGGVARCRRIGSYGILRLCRRDTAPVRMAVTSVPAPGALAGTMRF